MRAGRQFVLGVFVLAWLNVAAQPCLATMIATPDDNVAELAAHADAGADHAHHAANSDDTDGCCCCPPIATDKQDEDCLSLQASGCGIAPEFFADARLAKLQLKDLPAVVAIAYSPPEPAILRPLSVHRPSPGKRLRFTDSPSLSIRNCVFLI